MKVMQNGQLVKEITFEGGRSLLEVLRQNGMSIESPCGGKGSCGKCRVRIIEGDSAKASCGPEQAAHLSSAELKEGIRLACKIFPEKGMVIEIPGEGQELAEIMTGGEADMLLNPSMEKRHVQLDKPTVEDQRSDAERLKDALGPRVRLNHALLKELPEILRDNEFNVNVLLYENEVLGVESPDSTKPSLGLAVDIGTTTMVGYLMDLNTGKQLSVYSTLNPQRPYGADVISRIDYTIQEKNGLDTLQRLVIDEINKMISHFEKEQDIQAESIFHAVFVGNTVMMHILAGWRVKNIAVSPFIPVTTESVDLYGNQLGIRMFPLGKVSILPMAAGYVGADTTAAILACGMSEEESLSLMIDIGTNGEIALGSKDRILSCSTAAGPAFEGAHIHCGMGGVRGAVNWVRIDKGVDHTTIGNAPARGICGSGIVDAAAQMIRKGIVDPQGRMKTAQEVEEELGRDLASQMVEVQGKPAMMIVRQGEGAEKDVVITQKDIREVQLAKAAVAAGIQILLKEMGVSYEEVEHVYLAGGFGNYIDYDHAADIGLIPRELREKIIPIGNGAGVGAKMALLSKEDMAKAESIKKKMEYIELSTRLDFQMSFVDYMEFV